MTAKLSFDYCSDGRGTTPFLPKVGNDIVRCPQLPTTLPTLDELIGVDGITESTVAAHILKQTAQQPNSPHVYTLHTELEGGKLKPVFDTLLSGWKAQGYALTSTRSIYEALDIDALPVHRAEFGSIPGRSGTLMIQGERA
jgi:peptidoglycan/xylan/chitin deacetylase (PgdA/CDA1 family)